jgi:hypothetical protein
MLASYSPRAREHGTHDAILQRTGGYKLMKHLNFG